MEERARAWAARRFGWEEIAAGMVRAYEGVVARTRESVA
jgi:hypothetical protein